MLKIAEAKQALDALRAERTLPTDSAAEKKAKSLLKRRLMAQIRKHDVGTGAERFRDSALNAAHDAFEQYCNLMLDVDAMYAAPDDFVGEKPFISEEDVLTAAACIAEEANAYLIAARELWYVSQNGFVFL